MTDEKAGEEAMEAYMEILGDDRCACCGREDYETSYLCGECGMCDSCGCDCEHDEWGHDEGDYDPDDYR